MRDHLAFAWALTALCVILPILIGDAYSHRTVLEALSLGLALRSAASVSAAVILSLSPPNGKLRTTIGVYNPNQSEL